MARVTYVLRSFPEPSETFIRGEIRALRRAGVPVTVIAAWRSKPEAADWTAEDAGDVPVVVVTEQGAPGVPSRRMAGMLASDLTGLGPWHAARALRLAALAQAARPHVPADTGVLHAHFANDAAALARYVGRIADLPYRVTAHAYDLYQDPFLLDRNLKFASRILTISEANRAFIAHRLAGVKIADKAVEVVRCGIDLDAFAFREPHAPTSPARLLCVARLIPKKGHAVLLEAVARLRGSGRDVHLDAIGDGPLAVELAARAARPDLAGAVTLHGTRSHDEVRRALLAADVFVLASRIAVDGDRDGIPVALMEAMALGVPVVSTDLSGITELVVPGAGRVVPPDDSAALADAIGTTLALPGDARSAQARAARGRVEQEFDLRRIVERLK